MSWDKNTISVSGLDASKRVLDNLSIPYTLDSIGRFSGRGLNDGPYMDGSDKVYVLRRLRYKDKVILEYAELDADCDTNDVIHSQEFHISDEPLDWQVVRHTDHTGEYSF